MKSTTASRPVRSGETEVEIIRPPDLSPEQATVVDFHSVLNLLSILSGLLELLHEPEDGLDAVAEEIYGLAQQFRLQAPLSPSLVPNMDLPQRIRRQVKQVVIDSGRAQQAQEVAEMLTVLNSVLDVFEVRLAELEHRLINPGAWEWMRISLLQASMRQVLAAIEQNARGRYRIVENIAEQSAHDYQISLDFSSTEGEWILLPPVLQDVFRDLIANARKYTAPGGRITGGLAYGQDGLHLVVEDTGAGIPPEELPRVVEFGYRASNTSHQPTAGGGFGLTKAHWVTCQFSGRMWLRSELGRGTRITIWLPRPPEIPTLPEAVVP